MKHPARILHPLQTTILVILWGIFGVSGFVLFAAMGTLALLNIDESVGFLITFFNMLEHLFQSIGIPTHYVVIVPVLMYGLIGFIILQDGARIGGDHWPAQRAATAD